MSAGKLNSTYSPKSTYENHESSGKRGVKLEWSETFFDNLPTIYFVIDIDGVIRGINNFDAQCLGYQVEELIGKSILSIVSVEHREKIQTNLLAIAGSRKALKLLPIRVECKDGKILRAKVLGKWLGKIWNSQEAIAEDLIVMVIEAEEREEREEREEIEKQNGDRFKPGITEIITQKQEKENLQLETEINRALSLLHTTLESTADGIIAVNPTGNVVSFNQKFVEMFDVPKEYMLPGAQEQRLAFLEKQLKNPEGFLAKIQQLYAQLEAESYDIIELKDSRIFERYTQPQRLGEKIIGRVWCYRDITSREQAERTLRRQAKRERLILESLARIRSSLDLNSILQTTADEVRDFLDTDRVIIFQFFPDWKGVVVVESVREKSLSILNEEIYDPCFEKSYIMPYQHGRVRAIEDIYNAGIGECHLNLLSRYRVKANLVVPILQNVETGELETEKEQDSEIEVKAKNTEANTVFSAASCQLPKLWGLLIAHQCLSTRNWQQLEIDLLKQLATQVGIALYQSQLYEQLNIANQELQRLAHLDGLTQVANRRQFDRVLQQECQRISGGPLSLILGDIDCFKAYNDTYGHQAGDVCLQKVARAVNDGVNNSTDLVARYGGEELVVVLPNTDATRAFEVAEEIRSRVRKLEIPHANSSVSEFVTLSLGVASTSVNNCSPDMLIADADRALYQAKEAGRDRIILANQ